MAGITREEVLHVARLARLELSDDEVELRHLRDRLQDRRQLLLEAPDLVAAQLEPREPRDVADLVAIDHPATAMPR